MIIAARNLELADVGGSIEIPVRIFAPAELDGEWICSFEIGWPDGTLSRHATGDDAVQSIILALQMIGTLIYASDYHKLGRLVWQHKSRGYGFPVPRNIRDVLVGNDRTLFG